MDPVQVVARRRGKLPHPALAFDALEHPRVLQGLLVPTHLAGEQAVRLARGANRFATGELFRVAPRALGHLLEERRVVEASGPLR